MMYYINMVKNGKQLNKFELKLQADIENIMSENDVKFSVFLPVLRNDLPEDKSSNEYKNKHKAEYLKQLRASYSVDEIRKMLKVLGYKLVFLFNNKKIIPVKYLIDKNVKVRYTDLMAVCELLGIIIKWENSPIEQGKTTAL